MPRSCTQTEYRIQRTTKYCKVSSRWKEQGDHEGGKTVAAGDQKGGAGGQDIGGKYVQHHLGENIGGGFGWIGGQNQSNLKGGIIDFKVTFQLKTVLYKTTLKSNGVPSGSKTLNFSSESGQKLVTEL